MTTITAIIYNVLTTERNKNITRPKLDFMTIHMRTQNTTGHEVKAFHRNYQFT